MLHFSHGHWNALISLTLQNESNGGWQDSISWKFLSRVPLPHIYNLDIGKASLK
jgi:hypothetical protein